MRAEELRARIAVEQLDAAFRDLGAVPGFNRARIGLIREHELAGGVARPDRGRHGLDQRAHGRDVVDLLLMSLHELGELVLDAADLAAAAGWLARR